MPLPDLDLHGDMPRQAEQPAFTPVPMRSLGDLNLNDELATQLNIAQNILAEVRHDPETPANQKAQVINSINGILKQIIDMQESLHNVETLKKIENALINSLKQFPDLQAAFYVEYGKRLGSS